ncbi:AraC family transcriptional regulator [Lysobacter gummosus]|uniref:AraC family transcriptional regulator n=1 Tax=Lysobacter gummosus TaxID=262324 RepID=A0ABY3XIA5_9GAMM|nr:AraC family transcriptional regulator [Lysobacter gummosus]ALN90937.1 bacterial regulatory helix-turn-helix, AraC family protein [Lysobacter gummosus]UNP31382.1 AraC family transcriptional regulator [Lysobacter gummosus]
MTVVDKALWIIERNSSRELSLPAVAAACGVSRSHLANAFGSATGRPVIQYLRARRLTRAAETLAGGAASIFDVALDAGYGSHEAFTRAFTELFAATPERVRERATTQGLTLVPPLRFQANAQPVLEPPRLAEGDAIRAVGLSRRHGFDSVVGIPIQWQSFMSAYADIRDRIDSMPIGIVGPADENGGFEYVCATQVAQFERVPARLIRVEIPGRRYAVFEHRAHVSTIFATYTAIWNEGLERAGLSPADAPVIERHHPSFDPDTGEGGIALWIPLSP